MIAKFDQSAIESVGWFSSRTTRHTPQRHLIMSATSTTRKQNTYTIAEKLSALDLIKQVGVEEEAKQLDYPRGSVSSWWKAKDRLRAYKGSKKSKTTKGQGRKELAPFADDMLTYMKDERREENVRNIAKRARFCRLNGVAHSYLCVCIHRRSLAACVPVAVRVWHDPIHCDELS